MSLGYASIDFNETNTNKNKSINSDKISSLLSAIHDNMNDNNLENFEPLEPSTSVGVENTLIKEGFSSQNESEPEYSKVYQESINNMNQYNGEMMNIVYPTFSQPTEQNNSSLEEKLNRVLALLEEQQIQKTQNVTEEIILYSFFGIFIIYLVDSFKRIGKYTR
jgi:hypothetical protein